MPTCPFCGSEEIDGADYCEECRQPLDHLTNPRRGTATERSLHKHQVYLLAPRKPEVVAPTATVSEVLNLLLDRGIGCVVVVDDEEIVGIFSERDALMRLGTRALELGDRPISEFMTASPETVEADAKIAFALHKMDIGGYRHLPVVSDGRIRGVISIRDILRYITDGLVPAEA